MLKLSRFFIVAVALYVIFGNSIALPDDSASVSTVPSLNETPAPEVTESGSTVSARINYDPNQPDDSEKLRQDVLSQLRQLESAHPEAETIVVTVSGSGQQALQLSLPAAKVRDYVNDNIGVEALFAIAEIEGSAEIKKQFISTIPLDAPEKARNEKLWPFIFITVGALLVVGIIVVEMRVKR